MFAIGAECKFCAILRRARELEFFDPWPELCSPLTPGMQLLNLSCSNDGQIVSAELGDHWRRMFEQLPSLGDGLVMTRNEAAILGRNMAFPELVFTTHGIKGASGSGGLWFDFRALGAARAVHLRSQSGHIFGLEFEDASGRLIHRFTATQSSNLEMLLGWVRLHQASTERKSPPSSFEENELIGQVTRGRPISPGGIVSILAACCEGSLSVRATVQTTAVVQSAHFIPQSLRPLGEWSFVCGDGVGLHFCPAQLTHARIAAQPYECGPRVLFYSGAATDKPALVLEPGDGKQEAAWQQLLKTLLHSVRRFFINRL